MRWAGWLVVGAVLAGLAHAQPAPLSGAIYLTDTLVVGEGETLSIGPGTSITGPGSIQVRGALLVEGNATARAEIAVPILLQGNGTSRIADARLWGVKGAALTVSAGNVTLERVAFEGNGEAARILAPARATLSDASFEDNARGLVLDLSLAATDVLVSGTTFQRNGQHLAAQLGSGRAPFMIVLERCDFGPVSPVAGARLPSILAHSDALLAGDDADRAILLRGNKLHGGDVALRVEGRGFHVESRNDSFSANRVALSLAGANVTLQGATLDSTERDIDGAATSTLALRNVVHSRTEVPVVQPPPGGVPAWILPALLVGVAVAAGSAWIGLRRRAPALVPVPAAAPAPDLAAPLKPIERRVLSDVLAHPGSAQAAVAARLGLSRQALHYHVKKLEARGLLVKKPQGRETRCFVPEPVADALREELSS